MKYRYLIAVCVLGVYGFAASTPLDVRQLGAKGDGATLDTEAIQKAIDQCGSTGGGIVQLPAGTYFKQAAFSPK